MKFYSAKERGFYDESIHGARFILIIDPAFEPKEIEHIDTDPESGETLDRYMVLNPDAPTVKVPNQDSKIPTDAVEITDEEHAALIDAQSKGATITADKNGKPIAVFPPPPTLEDIKAAKNAEINAARLAANSSTFEHAGKVFACDVLSRSDIDGTANHIALFGNFPPEFPGGWKAVDNSILQMASVDDFKAFFKSMTARGTENFNHAQLLKQQIAAAVTPEQVQAISW
ncbi:uncharacterized protein DUF4376 [Paucimonas lemoignei]|uniref:Uncharacterized protein DUF4376 n=1 Tax=Paucimonas lemoignei TaxID=29443 RepID=A0A4R3HS96_PAULE|nr:DUF4376 domain-containing protein [Paucimonas lemoignei]TCS35808.1 uncharacterized protein DUF4376 [Paucimonas lemoignei]